MEKLQIELNKYFIQDLTNNILDYLDPYDVHDKKRKMNASYAYRTKFLRMMLDVYRNNRKTRRAANWINITGLYY